ncbi:M15 family metallopeptidase [Herbiconiux moechotypicola]|uniref:D-alanyl-D-alanine carboxypeptidase-like core domain-containing protein n=1 Tax=Herbiconiux moechotypicola TaxID=637393 RepID=A0ABN3DCF8_9MICO|nr:M15 family metallopeptidase [Herbiconiux moechotypicola]MCS5728723.1 M15 family metallopeptidase [Herbiconiux moechotypicola]
MSGQGGERGSGERSAWRSDSDVPSGRGVRAGAGAGTRAQVRAARRKRATRQALLAAGATVLVAAVVTVGALSAGGVIRFGAAPAGTPVSATGVATTTIPAPSFTEAPATDAGQSPPASEPPASEPASPPPPPAFDKAAKSIDDPTSPWVVVDKLRPLAGAAGYVPPDLVELAPDIPNPNGHLLRADAAASLEQMFAAARAEIGVQLVAQSGYRSYDSQVYAYNYYVNLLGVDGADLTSARPGYSEHQTGMAMDILGQDSSCTLDDGPCFSTAASGQWLAANAWRFGWILRYPDGATPITGYEFEPWHYRWVGVELATEMHATGVTTLEEFFGLPPAPGY